MPYVAYNGGGELVTALLGGHISVAYTPVANFLPHKDAIRVIAVSSAKRDAYYPDAPTFVEQVDKNLVFDSVYGIVGPRRIPADRVERLQELFKEALADPGVQAKLQQVYIRPSYLPGAEFGKVLKQYSDLFEDDVYTAIDLTTCCEGRTSYGGPSEASVNNQIALATAQLTAWEEKNA